jgi:hypothetical protein
MTLETDAPLNPQTNLENEAVGAITLDIRVSGFTLWLLLLRWAPKLVMGLRLMRCPAKNLSATLWLIVNHCTVWNNVMYKIAVVT